MENHPLEKPAPPAQGIVVPLVTPMLEWDTLDVEGLEKLIGHVLTGGVQGIFILGTTGEAPSLSYRLRRELIERTCRLAAGCTPVLVGITDTAFSESIRMAEKAAQCGACAVVVAPPYYFPAGQPELLEYLQHLVPRLPLPAFLYNMPSHTKVFFEPATVKAAAEIPGVIGLKDSSGNMIYFHQLLSLLRQHEQFSLFIGAEELLAETILLGGHGGICGGANLEPRLYVELYEASKAKDWARVSRLHARAIEISARIYRVGRHPSSYLKGLKCSLGLLGICSDFMAEPFHRFRSEEREIVRQHLLELGILGNSDER